jgi:hypothetical protein
MDEQRRAAWPLAQPPLTPRFWQAKTAKESTDIGSGRRGLARPRGKAVNRSLANHSEGKLS